LLLHITLKQVARQRHQTNKSRIFYRRWLTKWELYGEIDYPRHYGLIERPIRHHWVCHHISQCGGIDQYTLMAPHGPRVDKVAQLARKGRTDL
jgi:hypothetical protein